MTEHVTDATGLICVALVDGDPSLRHARQIMLRSENFDVRSYGTSAALLADPRSLAVACIVLDVEANDADGEEVLRAMRAAGWRGRAILLDDQDTQGAYVVRAAIHGDQVLDQHVGDGTLVAAINAQVDWVLHDRTTSG